MRRPLTACGALLLLAACEAPVPPTTERIIRIQIEGCADATPLPATPAPSPSLVAVAPTAPPATSVAPAIDTPAVLATPFPRIPERDREALAEDFRAKKQAFETQLAVQRLSPLDVPAALDSYRRALDYERAKNFDEALRHIEVALLDSSRVKIGEPFIQQKFARVESRLGESRARLAPRDRQTADEGLQKAQAHFLKLEYKKANAELYAVEQLLELRLKPKQK